MLSPAPQTLLVILTFTFLMMIKVAKTYMEKIEPILKEHLAMVNL